MSFFIFEEAFVRNEVAEGLALAVLTHALVEGGEEEILQDGLIVLRAVAAVGLEVLEDVGQVGAVEELFRDEALFLDEPAEDEPSEQTDEPSGASFLVVRFEVGRKVHLR